MLGLPDHVTACLFDLDGVLTPTAKVHTAAWEETFNAYLRLRAEATGTPYVPFDPGHDYHRYVDGRTRADGVRSFFASRGITLPEGSPADVGDLEPATATVNSVGNAKNTVLLERLRKVGVEPYPGSVAYLRAAEKAGLARAVVSASANCREVIEGAGIAGLLQVRVDGLTARAEGLAGKPAPDTFLAAAARLGVEPRQAAVFEDALAGVAAGRAGGFGFVVGVDRVGQAEDLYAHGADTVVRDLDELLSAGASQRRDRPPAAPGPAPAPTTDPDGAGP